MVEGTVKWFNESKGFGFLSREGGPDVFVHHSEIRAEGFRTLNEGDKVRCEVVDSPKGPRAANGSKILRLAPPNPKRARGRPPRPLPFFIRPVTKAAHAGAPNDATRDQRP